MRKLLIALVLLFWLSPRVLLAAEGLSLREVAAGVYVHQGSIMLPNQSNRGEIANIGFVVGERCVAVIDSGGSPEQGRALKAAIEAKTRVPVCFVINTHVHPDHLYGNIAFKQAGVSFVGHRKLGQALTMRAPFYLEKAARETGISLKTEDLIVPDRLVDGALALDLGGRTLQITAQDTAHTDNDLTIFDTQTETLWLADLLFLGHIPVIDGSLNGWLKVLDRLKGVKAKLAIPGHGPVSANWPDAAEAEIRYLQSLRNEIRRFLQAGKTLESAMDEIAVGRKDWLLSDEFHRRNVATAFAELEWEDD